MNNDVAQALIRFGLGRRGTEPAPADPHGWLAAQIAAPDPALAPGAFPGAPSTAEALAAIHQVRQQKPAPDDNPIRPLFREEQARLAGWAATTPAPFRERLVWFWANHFTVSIRGAGVAATGGAYLREAIRPHVTGRFADLLLAVMRHPAMLLYLDNAQSVGPDSPAGQRGGRGLNENLARECLELHTLGVAAGYSQADVTEFARVLTGWSVELAPPTPGFLFRPRAHQPGPKTVLGQVFPDGEAGGVAALRFLADHPATHRHLALKLARHFVADVPAEADIRAIETSLRDSGGDLGAAARAVIAGQAAWQPGTKLRTPQDFVIAVTRALDQPEANRPNMPGMMAELGQPLWNAPLPNGWSDAAADWAGPEAVLRRVDWSYTVAGRGARLDPQAVADACLGPLCRDVTRQAMRRAGSRQESLGLLFASSEFQRR